jgi:integrase
VLGQSANVKKLRETGSAPATLVHPVEARERQRKVSTLAVFAERYLAEHSVPHKAAASVKADRSLLGVSDEATPPRPGSILAALGELRMDRITRADVVGYHLGMKDTPTRANRAVALLSHMFSKAEEWGVRQDGTNPCRHVDRFKEERRERFLSAEELGRLGKALAVVEAANKVTHYGLAAIRLLLFTGARASEVLGLTWENVSIRTGTVRLQRKGRIGTLYLPAPAQAVLSKLPRLDSNPHVIVGRRKGEALTLFGVEQVWQVVRKAAGLENVRLHDLRHSFASVAAAGGQSLPMIGALLGHTQPATTARYAHLQGDPLAAAAKATARQISAAMRPKKKASRKLSNVVSIRGRR